MRAEQVRDPVAYHAEGPVWSQRWGGLRWVDMLAGDVLSLAPDDRVRINQGGCDPDGSRAYYNDTARHQEALPGITGLPVREFAG